MFHPEICDARPMCRLVEIAGLLQKQMLRAFFVLVVVLPHSAGTGQVDSNPSLNHSAVPAKVTLAEHASRTPDSVRPPAGRLAIVADGNSPDPDDIGATAVIFGLLKATGVNDRLVHLSHSCDLKPTERISAADELRRQRKLEQLCDEGIAQFGPFKNLADHFNCRTEQQAAVDDLRNAINRSTARDPLWVIEAGEPDMIGYALLAADASARKYVHVVSHHPANDNAGDFFAWKQILDFGVIEHQIGDQNVGLQSATNAWDWAKQHENKNIQWIYQQLAYAERDGVVKFQTNKFDCSDAGMVYWWLTGANQGGNANATPADVARMLQMDRPLSSRVEPIWGNAICFGVR